MEVLLLKVFGHYSTVPEAEPMLRDDDDRQDEHEPVSPISRVSNNDGFLASDQEERRRYPGVLSGLRMRGKQVGDQIVFMFSCAMA
jgi:hypothetical protein